jgi:hypothetical protein
MGARLAGPETTRNMIEAFLTSVPQAQGCSSIRNIRIQIRIREYSTNSKFKNWRQIRRIEIEIEFSSCNEFEYC